MTASGFKALEDEIQHLKNIERPAVIRMITEARAHGDLSENAEYHAAKERQGFVNARLGQLRKRLAEISLINFNNIPKDRVAFGSTVELQDLDPPNSYTIVGQGEGGIAGFAKGGAKVTLSEGEAGTTVLRYDVEANVGGKIAQLGARLIDGVAKKNAELDW